MFRILPLALFAAASASAQTPTFYLTASSANGGADTLFTWSYTGTLTFTTSKKSPIRRSWWCFDFLNFTQSTRA